MNVLIINVFCVVSLLQNKNKLVTSKLVNIRIYNISKIIHTHRHYEIYIKIALRKIYCMHDIQNVLEYFKESE